MKIVNFKIDEDKWNEFKEVCHLEHTDASKQLRIFVDSFLSHGDAFANEERKKNKDKEKIPKK